MSVSRPALQQVPRGPVVRSAFKASPGNRLVLVDYEQMEFRLFAAYTEDPTLIARIHAGDDMHQIVGDLIGISRQHAKAINFGLAYGAGVETIARTAGIPVHQARVFLDRYWMQFPRAKPFMDLVINWVRKTGRGTGFGFVTTLVGRQPSIPTDKAYAGINYLIQGGCADLLKQKLVDLDNLGIADYICLLVHDEVILDAPSEDADDLQHEVERVLHHEFKGVPLAATGASYENWGDKYRDAA